MNELSRNFAGECLLAESHSMSMVSQLGNSFSSNFSNNSSCGLTPLPSLEQSFLQTTKARELPTYTGKHDGNFFKTNSFSECINYERTPQCEENELFSSENNQFVKIHPYSQSQDYDHQLMNYFHNGRQDTKTCYTNHLHPQYAELNSSYEYVKTQINIIHSSGLYHDHHVLQEAMNSKSSLTSLESLASSISAVPILDPELFNLSKDRKQGNKSSKFGKSLKSSNTKRRKIKINPQFSQSNLDCKEILPFHDKRRCTKEESPHSTNNSVLFAKQEQEGSTNLNGKCAEAQGNSKCCLSSSKLVVGDISFIHPTVPVIPPSEEQKPWKTESAVYADLTKIKIKPTKRK